MIVPGARGRLLLACPRLAAAARCYSWCCCHRGHLSYGEQPLFGQSGQSVVIVMMVILFMMVMLVMMVLPSNGEDSKAFKIPKLSQSNANPGSCPSPILGANLLKN